jgi:hypothetical protein
MYINFLKKTLRVVSLITGMKRQGIEIASAPVPLEEQAALSKTVQYFENQRRQTLLQNYHRKFLFHLGQFFSQ